MKIGHNYEHKFFVYFGYIKLNINVYCKDKLCKNIK